MSETKQRSLSGNFMKALQEGGSLHWVLERVKTDRTICLEIRDDYINLYYRGGNLLKISKDDSTYSVSFDENYLREQDRLDLPKPTDLNGWKDRIPFLKNAMDLWFGGHPKKEREFQQIVVRANNYPEGKLANSTDYYICDQEYASQFEGCNSRFDLVALRWISKGHVRKKSGNLNLAIVEMKYGDGAIKGNAGIEKHLEDVEKFASDPKRLDAFREEMMVVFNQKKELGLIHCPDTISKPSDSLELLFLIANHDPESRILFNELKSIEQEEHKIPVRFVRASYCGYGIFENKIMELDEFKKTLEEDYNNAKSTER